MHLILAIAVGLLVYLPVSWSGGLKVALMVGGMPVAALTGAYLWQQGRIRRWWGRRVSAGGDPGRMVGRRFGLRVLLPLLGLAVAGAFAAQVWLQATFAGVRHPVPLSVANTTADPAILRAWYRVLAAQGTLERMRATELVDYVWIVGLAACLVLLTTVVARLLSGRNPHASSVLYRLAPWTAVAAAVDGIENAISLVMLADPVGFWDPLAYAHAAVSWVKLGSIIAVGIALPVYVLWALRTGGVAGGGQGGLPPRLAPPVAH